MMAFLTDVAVIGGNLSTIIEGWTESMAKELRG
jgi:hypothetical protein